MHGLRSPGEPFAIAVFPYGSKCLNNHMLSKLVINLDNYYPKNTEYWVLRFLANADLCLGPPTSYSSKGSAARSVSESRFKPRQLELEGQKPYVNPKSDLNH